MYMVGLLIALAAPQTPPPPPAGRPAVFAPGTRIPIRFERSVRSGRDSVGTPVGALTMSDLEAGGCVVVPAYAPLYATIVASKRGGLFGRRGYLELRFDSVLAEVGHWTTVAAVLDSLEWTPHRAWQVAEDGSREIREGGRTIPGVLGAAGAVGVAGMASGVGVIPVVAITGLDLALRGPAARILTGQRGSMRLTAPLVVPMPRTCVRPASGDSPREPPLPPLPAIATDKRGTTKADPINLIFRGTSEQADSAFLHAGWLRAQPSTLTALAKEVGAIAFSAGDPAAPMSHEYYLGRVEDLRFERASPSARARHHVRLWQADATGTLWAAAATEDVGMLVSARRHTITHRIAPDVDRERDLLASELLAGGCARAEGYVRLPGSGPSGASIAGQRYFTDARAVVLRLVSCTRRALPLWGGPHPGA